VETADALAKEITPQALRICTAFRKRHKIKANGSGVLIY